MFTILSAIQIFCTFDQLNGENGTSQRNGKKLKKAWSTPTANSLTESKSDTKIQFSISKINWEKGIYFAIKAIEFTKSQTKVTTKMQNGILQNSTSLYPICSLLPRLIEEFYLHLSLLFFRFFCSVKAALIVLLFSSSSFSKQNILSISLGAFGV